FTKLLTPGRKSGNKPVLVACPDSGKQATFVAQRVLELHEEGVELDKMVVLYRSHFHALELQLELVRRNIPFSITSGVRFFEQAHIKDVTAYLKLTTNVRDEISFKRLVQLLPGVGGKGADKLWKGYLAGLTEVGEEEKDRVARALQSCASSVGRKTQAAWAQFSATMSQVEQERLQGSISDIIHLVLQADYEDYLQKNY